MWVTPYIGAPHELWVDQAKSFLSEHFKALATALGARLVPIAVEAHWSMLVERHHAPLRRIYLKLANDYPNVFPQVLLDYACMAMNSTIGPENHVPAILAFGAIPRLPIGDYTQAPHSAVERFNLAHMARREYEAIVAELRIKRAVRAASPNERILDVLPGDAIDVYRERKGWEGPYTYEKIDGKLVYALDNRGLEHMFHSAQVRSNVGQNHMVRALGRTRQISGMIMNNVGLHTCTKGVHFSITQNGIIVHYFFLFSGLAEYTI